MDEPVRRLHKESRPLAWEALLDTQRDVARAVHDLIRQMGDELAQPDRWGPDPKAPPLVQLAGIDRSRSNRVLLIDGGRGSGKTSLLVTLVDIWARTATGRGSYEEDVTVRNALDGVAVVPTAIVDLQPLPESAHLMLHLCNQLRRFTSLAARTSSDARAIDPPATETTWEAFAHAAAKVWQPRSDRSGRLSPEDLAAELEDVEAQRLGLLGSFREFVDALIVEVRASLKLKPKKEILLVVPIDDFDLNPWRSLEVLDLVRWLNHPRVAFVLAGSRSLLERVVYADTLGHLARQLRELPVAADRIDAVCDRGTVTRLTKDILNKVIPPSHTARLQTLTGPERLARPEIQTALRGIKVPVDDRMLRALGTPASTTLLEYLRDSGLSAALPGELRRLLHVAETVGRPMPATSRTPQLARTIDEIVSDAWARSDIGLTGGEFQDDSDLYAIASQVEFTMSIARSTPFALSTMPGKGRTEDKPTFEILDEASILSARLVRDEESEKLSPQLANGLMLLLETRALRRHVDNERIPVCKAVFCRSVLRERAQAWPMPRFGLHLEQRAFLRRTNSLREACAQDEESFAASYLGMVLQLRQGIQGEVRGRDAKWVLAAAAKWFRAGERLKASDFVRVAAPEFGMSKRLSARWIDLARTAFGKDWKVLAKILAARRKRPSAEPADHPWHRLVAPVRNAVSRRSRS